MDGRQWVGLSGNNAVIRASIDTRGLSGGLHRFNFRLKRSDGAYSAVTTSTFLNMKAESEGRIVYWFDNKSDQTASTPIADTENEQEVTLDLQDMEKFPLGFQKADLELCFNRIDKKLRMPKENLHFPTENPAAYSKTFDQFRCVTMQGGQGETKHWAFNDPVKREGKYKDNPPTPAEYLKKGARVVELHPITLIQNARTSGGGTVQNVPSAAVSVGPKETWKAEKVSIWHPGHHDNPFGQRLSTFMISKKIADSCVPMSLLSKHPGEIIFNFYRYGFGVCEVEMH